MEGAIVGAKFNKDVEPDGALPYQFIHLSSLLGRPVACSRVVHVNMLQAPPKAMTLYLKHGRIRIERGEGTNLYKI